MVQGSSKRPAALILAGPNGAGKTTSSRWIVPTSTVFLNPDVIAARLVLQGRGPGGLDVAAGRVVLDEMRALVAARESFCVETNLAGRGFVGSISSWRQAKYTIQLAFIALDSADLALARVSERVDAGGHDVPQPVVIRRWKAGLRSFFEVYRALVDEWLFVDNSDDQPVIVAHGSRFAHPTVLDEGRWRFFGELAQRV